MRKMVYFLTMAGLLGLIGCDAERNTTVQNEAGNAAAASESSMARASDFSSLDELMRRTAPKAIDDPNILAEAFPMLDKQSSVWTADSQKATRAFPTWDKQFSVQTTDPEKTNEAILSELANHEIYVRTYSVDADGKISFLPANIAGKGKRVVVQQDYVNFKRVQSEGRSRKIGIMLRVEAELVTKSADVNLNGLFAIGLAVRAGSAAGTLRICVYGLTGEPINSLIPMPSEISESSLQNAMQAVASLKTKIYDPKVSISPQDIPD